MLDTQGHAAVLLGVTHKVSRWYGVRNLLRFGDMSAGGYIASAKGLGISGDLTIWASPRSARECAPPRAACIERGVRKAMVANR